MIDPKLLRTAAEAVAENLLRRQFEFDVEAYGQLEERRKSLQVDVEKLRAERNASAKKIGKAKAQGEDIAPLLAAVEDLGAELDVAEGDLQAVQATLGEIESGLPNLLHDDVPPGTDDVDNQEVMRTAMRWLRLVTNC